jgi:hypothetical protein
MLAPAHLRFGPQPPEHARTTLKSESSGRAFPPTPSVTGKVGVSPHSWVLPGLRLLHLTER